LPTVHLKEIQLRSLFVIGYILPDVLAQYLGGGYVLRLTGFEKSLVQFRFDTNTKTCRFPHCVAIGYTFSEVLVYALKSHASSGFGRASSLPELRPGFLRADRARAIAATAAAEDTLRLRIGGIRRRNKKGRRNPAALELLRRKAIAIAVTKQSDRRPASLAALLQTPDTPGVATPFSNISVDTRSPPSSC